MVSFTKKATTNKIYGTKYFFKYNVYNNKKKIENSKVEDLSLQFSAHTWRDFIRGV